MIPACDRPFGRVPFYFTEASLRQCCCRHKKNKMRTFPLLSIAASAALYFGFYHLNLWLFSGLQLHAGATWVFLPAGLRLMCTLVFGGEGALGVLLGSLAIVWLGFPLDPLTGVVMAFVSAGAPYLAYRAALMAGMPATLQRLSPASLGVLGLLYAFANSTLHSVWYTLRGVSSSFLHNWITMFVGDLLGTLIMVYVLKMLLALMRSNRRPA